MFSSKRNASGHPEYSNNQGNATVIANGVKLQGDFISQGDVIIEGEVQGHIEAGGQLSVGADAKLKADVKAGDATVAGIIEGALTVQKRLDLKATARIIGDLTCETASIEAGAVIHGKVMIGAAPETHDETV